jgi:hypothetical protein
MRWLVRLLQALRLVSSSSAPPSWRERLNTELDGLAPEGTELRGYLDANADAIKRAITGRGPDSEKRTTGAGAHMAVNIAAAYVPAFCEATTKNEPRPYQNCYDLEDRRIGDPPSATRVRVDQSLPTDGSMRQVCFGAVEVNGTGVRFYGDFCFVLNDTMVRDDTIILDRNSYDIERLPLSARLEGKSDSERAAERKSIVGILKGNWTDLHAIASIKLLERFARRRRRLTVGEISDAMLADEDYVEIVWLHPSDRKRSFGASDLLEVRVSAADVALEERIGAHGAAGPPPSATEMTWRSQRRRAEDALGSAAVPIKVVTTTGRIRS